MSVRLEKINRQLQKELMDIIRKEIDDPASDFLSITRVETTPDLSESKVYFSLLNEKNYKKVQVILEKMNGFIRNRLGKRIKMRILPKLRFIADDSIKYSVEIYQKIEDVMNNEKNDKGTCT